MFELSQGKRFLMLPLRVKCKLSLYTLQLSFLAFTTYIHMYIREKIKIFDQIERKVISKFQSKAR